MIVKLDLVINIGQVRYCLLLIIFYAYIFKGHACAGTDGYCDVFGKCRAVDAEGPLTRLKNMLLNKENIRTLKKISQVCLTRISIYQREFSCFRTIGGLCY